MNGVKDRLLPWFGVEFPADSLEFTSGQPLGDEVGRTTPPGVANARGLGVFRTILLELRIPAAALDDRDLSRRSGGLEQSQQFGVCRFRECGPEPGTFINRFTKLPDLFEDRILGIKNDLETHQRVLDLREFLQEFGHSDDMTIIGSMHPTSEHLELVTLVRAQLVLFEQTGEGSIDVERVARNAAFRGTLDTGHANPATDVLPEKRFDALERFPIQGFDPLTDLEPLDLG